MKKAFQTLLIVSLFTQIAFTQPPPSEKLVKIIVAPERADWTYAQNEKVRFNIMVLKNSVLLPKPKNKNLGW